MGENGNYKPNSLKPKEEAEREKRVEKVITGNVKVKKKSALAGMIISEDASSVKDYVLKEVIVPSLKKLASEMVTSFVDGVLFGGQRDRGERRPNASYVSYNRYSDRGDRRSYESSPARINHTYEDFVFDSRAEAEYVLSQMHGALKTYGMLTIADLYDMVGESCDYTYQDYGWTNLRNAEVVRVRSGYSIKLPKALPID